MIYLIINHKTLFLQILIVYFTRQFLSRFRALKCIYIRFTFIFLIFPTIHQHLNLLNFYVVASYMSNQEKSKINGRSSLNKWYQENAFTYQNYFSDQYNFSYISYRIFSFLCIYSNIRNIALLHKTHTVINGRKFDLKIYWCIYMRWNFL